MKGSMKVCKHCKRFVLDSKCPACNTSDFSRSWKGVAYIADPNGSEVAEIIGVNAPGKYALWVK